MLILLLACTAAKEDDSGSPAAVELPADCSALPTQEGTRVSDVGALLDAVAAGDPVILLEDGSYSLTGGDSTSSLVLAAGVTLRSASGDASAVVLEAGFATGRPVVLGAGATLAEVTVAHAAAEGVVIEGAKGARVFGVVVSDPADVGIAVLPDGTSYSDGAEIACSEVRFADECGLGVDVAQAQDTHVRDLRVSGCDDTSIRLASGSRGSVVERVFGYAMEIGDTDYVGDERIYDAPECDGVTMGHYGGSIQNVMLTGSVALRETCGVSITHTTVAGDVFWASTTDLSITNALANLVGSDATLSGNLTPSDSDFVSDTDLHLAAGSAAIDAGVATDVTDDIDREIRDASPDVGADEFGG